MARHRRRLRLSRAKERMIPMQIGCFRADGAGFVGRVQTLTLDVAVRLVPTGFADHGRAPDWRVHFDDQELPDGVGIALGSGWPQKRAPLADYINIRPADRSISRTDTPN